MAGGTSCIRCGCTDAPLVWSSQSGFKHRVCASRTGCRKRRERQAAQLEQSDRDTADPDQERPPT